MKIHEFCWWSDALGFGLMWWPSWLTGIRSWQSIVVDKNVACSPSRQSVPWRGSHWQRRWQQPQPALLVPGSVLAASKRSSRCCAPQSAPALSLHHLSSQFAMPVTGHHSRNNYGHHTSLNCRAWIIIHINPTCTAYCSRNRLARYSLFLLSTSRLLKQITGSKHAGQLFSENDLNWHSRKQNEAQSAHAESTRKGVD